MSTFEQINYQISGYEQGKKLVFLHGIMGSLANWSRIKPAFEKEYQILVMDQRGHGHSFHPENGYTYEQFAKDLLNLVDELGWSRIHLVGHSMGGRVALVFCDQNPARVEKVVIEDITPAANPESSLRVEQWIKSVPTPFASKVVAKEFLFGPFLAGFTDAKEGLAIANFFNMNIRETDHRADWRVFLPGILNMIDEAKLKDRWREWENLKMAALVMRGEFSKDLSIADFERMLATNANSRGVQIPQSGHWVHFDQPQLFTQALLDFLSF